MTCAIIAKALVNTGFINEYEQPYSKIKDELRDTIWRLFCEGYTEFYSNCEYGVSLWAAETVIALKMYKDIKENDKTYKKVDVSINTDWYFSMKAFNDFKEKLQPRIKWKYSGETEIIILRNNPGKSNPLCFTNYVVIDVNKGIREGYIDSFNRFMESLIRNSKSEVTAKSAINKVIKDRISIREAIAASIDECKRIPKPGKRIIKDRLFYHCARSYKE